MIKTILNNLLLSILYLLFLVVIPWSSANAVNDKVTICHVVPPTPETITVSESALPAHLAHGDTLGACPTPPVVPEFGLITGAIALLTSGGAFYLLKKRV